MKTTKTLDQLKKEAEQTNELSALDKNNTKSILGGKGEVIDEESKGDDLADPERCGRIGTGGGGYA